MPNKSYIRGRKYEYDTMKEAHEAKASMVFRTAGSHGPYDIIAFYPPGTAHNTLGIIELTQCKTKLVKESKLDKIDDTVVFEGTYIVRGRKVTRYIKRRK